MTAALIITAGHTASQGRFEPFKPVGTISAVQRLIHIFQRAEVDRVVVVGGSHAELEKHVARMGVVCLALPQNAAGEMLDSVKLGLEYLTGKCRNALITPVDIPLFSVETVGRLLKSGKELAVPSHGGKAGHPLLVAAGLFPGILAYTGGGGLAAAAKRLGQPIAYVDVPDAGILLNIQKQPDFDALLQTHSLRRAYPEIKVCIAKEQIFFGPGPCLLLSLIDETASLRVACRQMGISYSKGWQMLKAAERQTGSLLVLRARGGSSRGSTLLTQNGRELLVRYNAFVKACRNQCQKLFEKHFGGSFLQPE